MNYEEAVDILKNANKRKKLYPPYLRKERLELLFNKLGINPVMPAVHIGGTSGKGSTSSLCAAVFQEAGYKVGLHTTPHLQTPRERMQVNGKLPSEEEFGQLVYKVYSAAIEVEETNSYGAFGYQELLFTTAALFFKNQKTDIAIIETFMGGQMDATNLIKPLVSVVTNVDLDHTSVLGKTVEAIAMVKAGVIKEGTPFITSATQPGVRAIFQARCRDLNSPCIVVGQENRYRSRLLGQKGSILSAEVLNNLFANIHISLLGRHQINNALLTLYIVQVLRARGWLIADEAIRVAFTKAFIPGRLEIVQDNPLIVLDGAHNPAKTKALAGSLKKIFKNRKAIFVFSMKKGKDLQESIKPLLPLAEKFIITRFSKKKSVPTSEIKKLIQAYGVPVTVRVDCNKALELAAKQIKKDQYICVTGSLYLVGKVRDHWHPYSSPTDQTKLDLPWSIDRQPNNSNKVPKS